MKKVNLLFWVCILYILVSVRCNTDKMNMKENPIHFDSIQVAETYYLFDDTTKAGCNIQISFTFPDSADNRLLKPIQNIFVEQFFGDSFKNLSPEQAVLKYIKQYIEGFKSVESLDHDTVANDDEYYKDESGYSCYARLKDHILFNRSDFLSFTVELLSYEGGAHSSKSIYGYVIDLKTGELLQEEQFAGNEYYSRISEILIDSIVKSNEVEKPEDLENLGYNSLSDIHPNNNFTIDDKGITYYFNENEIGGTMLGLTQIFIPYEEFKLYLNEEAPLKTLWR
ncbi:MAG: RsiV family protein [Candidatus Azobacteroides sp.]|nr:RsiV family protein [Candidatus Azobacteroides sp.]